MSRPQRREVCARSSNGSGSISDPSLELADGVCASTHLCDGSRMFQPRSDDRAPQVAVITAAYNAERFIDATIQSVRSQTFPHFEYVIVDDNSTDATTDVVAAHGQQDSRVRMLRQSVNA